MPDDFILYLLLVAALGIGFLLGRRELGRRRAAAAARPDRFLPSLHQLVVDQRGLDMEQFVESLISNDDPIDTRLALGALVRRKGDVEKAIRVHQGLLARPGLAAAQRSRVELELARDYMAAGLLDRAENLLLELAERGGPQRPVAQRALLEIYQQEREWQRAVEVGKAIARHDRAVKVRLAHFQCELAEKSIAAGDLRAARQALARGGDFDPRCARVSLTGAKVELAARRHRDACRLLRRAVNYDDDCVPLAVPLYREASDAMGDQAGFVSFLETCLAKNAHLPAVEALAAHLERCEGPRAAADFVMKQLLRNPTLGGFVTLLEHLDRGGEPLHAEQLALVRRFSESLLEKQAAYRCRNCGFSSHSLMWQCPSCHEWGSCRLISGADHGR